MRTGRNRAVAAHDLGFLATPAVYFAFPSPESMRRFREDVARNHYPSTPSNSQRLLEAGLLLASIVRSPANQYRYTAILRVRMIPELTENIPRLLKHFRLTASLKNPTTYQCQYGRISIEYPKEA
jgi:hypothetical protein